MIYKNGELELNPEQEEMFLQAVRICTDTIKHLAPATNYSIIPISCEDGFVCRAVNFNPDEEIEMKLIDKIGMNEMGRNKWRGLSVQEKKITIKKLFESGNYRELVEISGYNLLKSKMSAVINTKYDAFLANPHKRNLIEFVDQSVITHDNVKILTEEFCGKLTEASEHFRHVQAWLNLFLSPINKWIDKFNVTLNFNAPPFKDIGSHRYFLITYNYYCSYLSLRGILYDVYINNLHIDKEKVNQMRSRLVSYVNGITYINPQNTFFLNDTITYVECMENIRAEIDTSMVSYALTRPNIMIPVNESAFDMIYPYIHYFDYDDKIKLLCYYLAKDYQKIVDKCYAGNEIYKNYYILVRKKEELQKMSHEYIWKLIALIDSMIYSSWRREIVPTNDPEWINASIDDIDLSSESKLHCIYLAK